jgi:hypothetical protein
MVLELNTRQRTCAKGVNLVKKMFVASGRLAVQAVKANVKHYPIFWVKIRKFWPKDFVFKRDAFW